MRHRISFLCTQAFGSEQTIVEDFYGTHPDDLAVERYFNDNQLVCRIPTENGGLPLLIDILDILALVHMERTTRDREADTPYQLLSIIQGNGVDEEIISKCFEKFRFEYQ